MITMSIIIALLSAIMFAVAICIIVGGVSGLFIVCDIIVFVLIVSLFIRMLSGR